MSWSVGDSVSLTLTEAADAPDPPTDLTANAKGETQIDLSWTAPADNGGEAISGYKVEVSANGTTTWSDLAADTASTDTTYSHTGLAAGNTRHYRVSAINSVDTGDASGVAGATTAAANVLVSNTGRSVDPAIAAGVATGDEDKTHSQGFDTGPNPGGYSLASVGVYVTRPSLEAGEAFTVHIYTAASNGTLDTLQHTLTSPASYTDNAVNTFTAPAGATLDASTDYFVVFEGTANAGLDFVLGVTASNAQDRGTRVGWAIENARRFNSVTSSSGESFQISVNGTAIPTPMPSNSGLVPTGLVLGDTFRLLFLSSTRRTASASGIGTYNTHVQTAAAAGHTAIQAYSAGFRAVGCTSSQDANVNTRTLHTTSDTGVPIYWLNGAKAADDYADFYDGDWDEEAALKDESGTAATTTGNYPWTGCDHDGTELSGDALGSGSPVLGAPDSSFGTDGPISSSFADSPSETRPLYGLSELFAVAAAVVPNNAPTFPSTTANRSVAENTAAGQNVGAVLTATDSDGDTLTYTLEGTDADSFALDTTTTAGSARIRTKTGVTYNHEAKSSYTVVVKADDGNSGTDTVTVTISVTDVTEPPAQPAVPTVTTVSGSSDKLGVDWQAPANTGPDIDSYDLRYQKTTESAWTNGPQDEAPYATGGTVVITGLDAGTAYRVQVRATNAEGDSDWSPSGTGTTDAAGNTAATGNPEISGTAQVGMTLEAAPGDIDDADGLTGVSYSYRWRRAEVDIPGAPSSTYTLTSADYGQEIEVRANFTDEGGNAEQRISAATLPVAPAAAACPSDAATVWCTTLTVGHRLDDFDGDMGVAEAGYEARPGRTAFGSLGGATFRHLGVDYTVTSLHGGATQDLYFATTPNLPADGAGLTVHVQKYVGELDVPLAEGVFQSHDTSWFFQGALNTSASSGDTLSDMPLIHAPFARDQVVPHPPDLGTEVAVRLSYASTVLPGQTAVTFGASSYTASEGGAPATVAVELSAAPSAPVTIPLTPSRRGGATAGDYSGVPPSVTFQAGQTRLTFTVMATDDSVDDDGESVRIGFGTLPDGFVAGARPTATVALADNDGPVTEVFFDGAADLTVEEGNVTRVSVYLSEPARATVTIPLTRTHRGGATAADYSGVPASVTFRFRERRKQFTLRTTDDDDNDDNESLRIGFGPLPAGIRASTASHRPPTRTVHLEDDDGVNHWNVWFGAEAYTAAEGGAAARVSIHLDAPVEATPLDVRLTLRYGGGATAADHGSIPAVVTFAVGERTKTITVTATDDSDDDDGESVALWFGNPPYGRVSIGDGPITATVALEDNDGIEPVTVSFGAATYKATEGGSDATVRVELDTAPGRSVTVPLTKANGGGATAADYSGIPETVTFGASQTARTFTVTATDDSADDGGESVSIGFGPLPAGVSAGSPAAAAVTLADDGQLRSVVVNFGTSTSVVPRVREGVRFRFTLSLNRNPLRPVTIPLEVTHRGGATEADYEGLPASVTFGPRERQADFILRAVLDQEDETGEGLRIDFGPLPPGVRKGTWGPYETVEFVDTDPAANLTESPGVPEAPRVTLALDTSLTVEWTEPENPGPPITDYDVQYREGSSGFFINAPHEITDRTATLKGLEAATLYQVQVRARNEKGSGRWSEPGEGWTLADPTALLPFSVPDRGGFSVTSQDAEPMLRVGYGQVETDDGMTPPVGLAIFGSRLNGILVSEAGVPASAAVLEGRIFAETDGPVRTGLALANPNDTAATIAFFFTNSDGIDSGHGTFTLGPREQIARFLDEGPFNGGSAVEGTFTFTADLPVAVIALRGFVNERSEFLMTTLPVAPLAVPTTGTVYFPHFADGGGWTTQVILVNPTHAPISGSVQFFGPGSETEAAAPATLTLADGRSGSTFSYAIPPRSAARLRASNPAGPPQVGSVRAVPDPGQPAPSGVSIFAFQKDGMTVSEAGVPASTSGAAFRVYVEASGTPGQPHSVRSSIALTNTSDAPTTVSLELTDLDGTATGSTASLTIPASGHVARFIDEFFPALTTPFSGILRIASAAPDIAAVGLRLAINQRHDILVTTTPPVDENAAPTASDLFFPHFVDSGGWTTQFILFSGSPGQTASGVIRFTGQDGQPLELSVAPTAAPTMP